MLGVVRWPFVNRIQRLQIELFRQISFEIRLRGVALSQGPRLVWCLPRCQAVLPLPSFLLSESRWSLSI